MVGRLRAAASSGCEESRLVLSRRSMLGVTAGLFSWACLPEDADAGVSDPRLLVVVLRGGMDGLSTVIPHGDLDYWATRGELALPYESIVRLDDLYGMHPQLVNFHKMYKAGEAAVVHAVAPPLRTRSHFDCQDNLESGLPGRASFESGWLNRLLAALPTKNTIRTRGAMAIGDAPPILRGAAPVMGWSASNFTHVADPRLYLVRTLYRAVDREFYDMLERGLKSQALAEGIGGTGNVNNTTISDLQRTFLGAGRLLGASRGPRIAVMSVQGWDTHTDQGGVDGEFAERLADLDAGIAGFKKAVGSAWNKTVVLMVTEFGRTVANNGNRGSDHGVGTVALLAGGAVKGGVVRGDWPGLALANQYQARDLAPTTDLRSVFKGVLREHLAVPDSIINGRLFPESLAAPPMTGLIKGA